jgi:hypothetical protein
MGSDTIDSLDIVTIIFAHHRFNVFYSMRYGYRWRPTASASAPIGSDLGPSNAARKLISYSECHAKRRENS